MKFINEVDLSNKTVILRLDLNVPIKNNKIIDKYRIEESLETINYLINQNCKIIILSHMGKIKDKKDLKKYSLKIVYKELKKLLNTKTHFLNTCYGKRVIEASQKLSNKEILLLENTRYMDLDGNKESSCDEDLALFWASLAQVFVMDAFGASHRKHASTYGLIKNLPTCYGLLIKKELNVLEKVLNDKNKTLILGGGKTEDKLSLIKKLLPNSKEVLIAGKMCTTFLDALGKKVQKSQINENMTQEVSTIYKENVNKIVLPIDIKTENNETILVNDLNYESICDISNETINLFENHLKNASLVVWNGPVGNTDIKEFEKGTISLLDYLSKNKIKTIIAGGDTASVANKYNYKFYHISTGGGSTLKYLEEEKLVCLGGKYEKTNS